MSRLTGLSNARNVTFVAVSLVAAVFTALSFARAQNESALRDLSSAVESASERGPFDPTESVAKSLIVDRVPKPPADPRAAKAYAVFDTYCARCHQTGRLKGPSPAHPIANILALDDIARQPSLVQPRLPDGSALYTIMLRRHATLDLDREPQADAVQAVRDWIQDLPPDVGRCAQQQPITQTVVNKAIAADLATMPADKAKDIRYVSLTHLHNACTPQLVMAHYRQAVTKIINSLSWAPEPVRPETIDGADTILKLDLAEIGWVSAHWEKLVAASPYAGLASASLSDTERRRTGTTMPVVRADWLAHAAMTAPLYPALLGLPGRHVNLQRILNIDVEANIKSGAARRAGQQSSAVTRGNRLVERHPTRTGSLWMTYDFATSDARQNLAANPLGPSAGGMVKVPFKHDGTKSLYTLPNGFFAYSLNDMRGDRIDQSPDTIERDETLWGGPVGNGGPCMACHRVGPVGVIDSVRAQVEADTAAPKELRDAILGLYAEQSEMTNLISEDQERYATSQRRVGIDPDALVNGLEPVAALASEYTRPVGFDRLAAELGTPLADVQAKLAGLPVELQLSIRRLKLAVASRTEADRILVRLGMDAGTGGRTTVVLDAPEQRSELELLIWMSAEAYAVGDLATIFARASQNCYLTLVSIDEANRATVLFPNEFEQNNLLQAGKEFRLPGEAAPYQFRLKVRGRETVAGMCSTVAKSVDGIAHDFERQRFTMLGDWRAFLGQVSTEGTRPLLSAADAPRAPQQKRGRAKQAPPAATPEPKLDGMKPDAGKANGDVQARAAIAYDVR